MKRCWKLSRVDSERASVLGRTGRCDDRRPGPTDGQLAPCQRERILRRFRYTRTCNAGVASSGANIDGSSNTRKRRYRRDAITAVPSG